MKSQEMVWETFDIARSDMVIRRTKVPGGWLVFHEFYDGRRNSPPRSESMVYIPDPNHVWLAPQTEFKTPEEDFFDNA